MENNSERRTYNSQERRRYRNIAGDCQDSWRKCPARLHHSGKPVFLLRPNGAMDALPLRIYRLALLPYPYAQAQGWGAALVLILMVLVVNIGVRLATRGRLYSTRSRP